MISFYPDSDKDFRKDTIGDSNHLSVDEDICQFDLYDSMAVASQRGSQVSQVSFAEIRSRRSRQRRQAELTNPWRSSQSRSQTSISGLDSFSTQKGTQKNLSARRQQKRGKNTSLKTLNFRGYSLRLPKLTPYEVCRYRYSQGHMFCLDLLMEGYHRSFEVLFNLMRHQKEHYENSMESSSMSRQSLLEDDPQKLGEVKKELAKAEKIERTEVDKENFEYKEGLLINGSTPALLARYSAFYKLGQYFQGIEDRWLSKFFLQSALNMADKMQPIGVKDSVVFATGTPTAANSHLRTLTVPTKTTIGVQGSSIRASLGLLTHGRSANECRRRIADVLFDLHVLIDEDPELDRTIVNLQMLLDMAKRLRDESHGRHWTRDMNTSYHREALRRICRVSLQLAALFIKEHKDYDQALQHLQEANDAVEKAKDRQLQAQAYLALGHYYADTWQYEKAIAPLRDCEGLFGCYGEHKEASNARRLIGECYRRMQNIPMAREFLRSALGTAKEGFNRDGMVEVEFQLAIVDLLANEDKEAEQHMRLAFTLTREGVDIEERLKNAAVDEFSNTDPIFEKDEAMETNSGEQLSTDIVMEDVKTEAQTQEIPVPDAKSSATSSSSHFDTSKFPASSAHSRMRVAYGVISACSLMESLSSAAYQTSKAATTAIIQWKNNGLLHINDPLSAWEFKHDSHFSIFSEDGLVGKKKIEGFDPFELREETCEVAHEELEDESETETQSRGSLKSNEETGEEIETEETETIQEFS